VAAIVIAVGLTIGLLRGIAFGVVPALSCSRALGAASAQSHQNG
jgi:hypothetical protein